MKKLPNFRVFIALWIVLICYLSVDFIIDSKKNFLSFNYDWSKIEILEKVGEIAIDSISHDYLKIKNNFEISDAFSSLNTFSLEGIRKKYFRSSNIVIRDSTIVFSGVKWINQIPKKNLKHTTMEVLNLPLIQPRGKTTTTLGDSQIIWRDASSFRKTLSLKCSLFFVGRKSDVFGYPYEGGVFDKTTDLLEKIQNIEPTAYYILFFGAQDKKTDKNQLYENICEILNLLVNKKGVEQVFVITLPPSPVLKINKYNLSFNYKLLACAKSHLNLKIVDLYKYLEDKKSYLLKDSVHLNVNGYLFLNKLLMNEIK